MENNESRICIADSLTIDILMCIFEFLDTKSKGKVAQVSKKWREAVTQKSMWKNVMVNLRDTDFHVLKRQSIIKRGINRIHIMEFGPNSWEFLNTIPNMQHLQISRYHTNLCDFFKSVPSLKSLNLEDCSNVPKDILEIIASCLPFLHELNLTDCLILDKLDLLKLTSGLKKLKILKMGGHHRYPEDHIADIDNSHPAGSQSKDEIGLPSLERLYICRAVNTCLTEGSFKHISTMFLNIASLDVQACQRISNIGLKYLIQLKKLESLTLASCFGITNIGLKHITEIVSLKSLNLDGCNITDLGMQHIPQLKHLRSLSINFCDKITNIGFNYVNQLPSLEELNVKRTLISDTALYNLSTGPLQLTKFNLSSCFSIGDEGISHLCKSSFALQDLNLDRCDITDIGIEKIVKKFNNLQYFSIKRCLQLTNSSLILIDTNLKNLKKLSVSDNKPALVCYDALAKFCEEICGKIGIGKQTIAC